MRALLTCGIAVIASQFILGQTVPNFAPAATYGTGESAYWTVAADFNGDGLIDLAAPDGLVINNHNGFYIAYGTPGGGFGPTSIRSVGTLVQSLRAADFNNDGRADLVYTSASGTAVMLSNATGGFADPVYLRVPVGGNYSATGDFNGDGKQDVVVAGSNGYAVALGNGDGTFTSGPLLSQATASYWVVAGDFNNDGKLDFAGPGGFGGVTYLGNGDGTFRDPVGTIAIAYGTVVADFNNDGILDLAMLGASANRDGSNQRISICPGGGDGTFNNYFNYVLNVPLTGLVAGDFNADGKMDIATWVGNTRKLRVFAGDGHGLLNGDLIDSPEFASGALLGADVDGNGSLDLIHSVGNEFQVFRNTHGNPPLVAQLSFAPASVIGGVANTTGTVTLGGVAPAGGVSIALTTSNSAVAFFPGGPSVTVPAGASSATFAVNTSAVAAPTPVNVTASWKNLDTTTRLDLVLPYSLTGLTMGLASQFSNLPLAGTLTLSGNADSAAIVSLTSSNPAVAPVPATVTVPAGATSAVFFSNLQQVAVDTPVTFTASLGGVTKVSSAVVTPPGDRLVISKAQYTVRAAQLRVEVTDTVATATVNVYDAATGTLIGTLINEGKGKYDGTFAAASLTRITLRSSLGSVLTGAVELK